MNQWGQMLGILAVSVFFLLVTFLILREGVCWYFKINERLDLMREMNASMTALESRLNAAGPAAAARASRTCPKCGAPAAAQLKFCESCGTALA